MIGAKPLHEAFRIPAVLLYFALLYAILLSRFDLRLLFTDSILTGGDSASWLQPLKALKEEYLPRFRLFGYSQSNFFGYLEGQHYFILPFLFAAFLGCFMPLTIALKLATFVGILALPLTTFFGVRKLIRRDWPALAASAFSLLFLFNESYTMFGGNALSTFAGEFCYSWAIAILPLFVGTAWEEHRGEAWSLKSGLLLGAIGLCHFFVFMVAFFLPFFFAFNRKNLAAPRATPHVAPPSPANSSADATSAEPLRGAAPEALVLRIPFTYITAFLLMAFWLLPMIATRTWTQSISMIWRFSSLYDFARQTLAPVWIGALFLGIATIPRARRCNRLDTARAVRFLLYGLGACAFLFRAASVLEIPDIRFVPPALILSLFIGIVFLADLVLPPGKKTERVAGTLLALLALIASAGIVPIIGRNSGAWFAWNYSGYETKAQWSNLRKLSENYRGGIDDGRLLWEKQNQNDNKDFGSERGFENLRLFSGRPSTEGIHYGSSFMARAATYLQSCYSLDPVDPEAYRLYSNVDALSWPLRFRQVNASHIITHSLEITKAFAEHKDFRLDGRFGKFSVFAHRDFRRSYVEILDPTRVSIVADSQNGFKKDFYRYFRDYELIQRPFVPASFADAKLESRIKKHYANYDALREVFRESEEWREYACSPSPVVGAAAPEAVIQNETIGDFEIRFTTTRVGLPHLIKCSYAPGWRSMAGERVYPISPGFMLLWPATEEVRLGYGRSVWEWIGIAMSLSLLPALVFQKKIATLRLKRFRPLFIAALCLFLSMAAAFATLSMTGTARMIRDLEKAQNLAYGDEVARARAAAIADRYATPEYLERYDNQLAFDAYRLKADLLAREGKAESAASIRASLRSRFPHVRASARLP